MSCSGAAVQMVATASRRTQLKTSRLVALASGITIWEDINRNIASHAIGWTAKKNVYFRALPKSPKPPLPRIRAKNSDDDNDGCNDNYDDNDGNFDDNDDKND